MRRDVRDAEARRARDSRFALAGLLALSLVANLALSVGMAGRDATTVLVPGKRLKHGVMCAVVIFGCRRFDFGG